MTPHISTSNPVGQHRSYTIWYQESPSVDGGGGSRKCNEIKILVPALNSKFWLLSIHVGTESINLPLLDKMTNDFEILK